MKVDDLLRRTADEVKEAGREARFTVRAPGSSRRRVAVVAFAAAAVALAVGVPLLLFAGPWRTTVGPEPAPTSVTSTTVPAVSTTLAPGEMPVASVGELVTGIFAALTAGDAEALSGLFVDGTYHWVYTLQGSLVLPAGGVDNDTYQPVGEAWEVLGEVLVSGEVAATPVQVTYTQDPFGTWRGFDVTVVEEVPGGFLGGAGLTLFTEVDAPEFVEADPVVVAEVLASQAAAWAAGDVDGVLAGYGVRAKYINGSQGYSRDRALLADLYAGMRLEFVGEPVVSGPFFAVATRVTDLASGVVSDGISVYLIREGEIALHILTTGP